jgi:stalled ribosome rescue protein Dom34
VILEGEVEALPILRAALSRPVAKLVREVPRSLGAAELSAPADTILEAIQPLMEESRAERERTLVARLVEAVQSDRLGVAGLEATRRALAAGEVETLVLLADAAKRAEISGETSSQLIDLASRTDADVAVVDESPELQRLGGVGALLRYRVAPVSLP